MLKRKKTMPSGKPGHGSKRPTDAQPQNEILRSRGLGGNPQQAAPEAEWLSRGIACLLFASCSSEIKCKIVVCTK